jgi:hypothetical protein
MLGNVVDESVLIADSARPVAGEVMFQRLGLAQTFVSVLDEQVDPLSSFRSWACHQMPAKAFRPRAVAKRDLSSPISARMRAPRTVLRPGSS